MYRDPPIFAVEKFLSPEQCDRLICLSFGRLQDAHVVGRGEGATNTFGYRQGKTPGRTSRTCTLSKEEAAFLIAKAEALAHTSSKTMELPQVGVYARGQRYDQHFDAVEPTAPSGQAFLANGGQRIMTILVYLNTPSSGGRTAFPMLHAARAIRSSACVEPPDDGDDVLRFRPLEGNALVFFPAFADGKLDQRCLHCAEAATGTKWVSQVWVRQNEDRRDAEPSKRIEPVSYDPVYEGRSVVKQFGAAPAEGEDESDNSDGGGSGSEQSDEAAANGNDSEGSSRSSGASAKAARGIPEMLRGVCICAQPI